MNVVTRVKQWYHSKVRTMNHTVKLMFFIKSHSLICNGALKFRFDSYGASYSTWLANVVWVPMHHSYVHSKGIWIVDTELWLCNQTSKWHSRAVGGRQIMATGIRFTKGLCAHNPNSVKINVALTRTIMGRSVHNFAQVTGSSVQLRCENLWTVLTYRIIMTKKKWFVYCRNYGLKEHLLKG